LSLTSSIIGGIGKCMSPIMSPMLGPMSMMLPPQSDTAPTARPRQPAQGNEAMANEAMAAAQAEVSKGRKEIAEKKRSMKTAATPEDLQRLGGEIEVLEEGVKVAERGINQASAMAQQHADSLEAQESMQRAQRQHLQNQQREQTELLAQTVEELKHMRVEKDNVESALKSLQLCVVTLGKIRVTFADVKMFWEQVATHCKKLAKDASADGSVQAMINVIVDDPDVKDILMDEFTEQLIDSAKSWAALGLQSNTAWGAMVEAKGGMDALMADIPVGDCSSMLQSMLANLDAEAKEDMAALESQSA